MSSIQPWQVPLLVMMVLAIVTALYAVVTGLRPEKDTDSTKTRSGEKGRNETPSFLGNVRDLSRQYVRTSSLGLLTVVLAVIALGIIGPPVSDRVTTLTTSLAGLISAVATWRSYGYEKDPPPGSSAPTNPSATSSAAPSSAGTASPSGAPPVLAAGEGAGPEGTGGSENGGTSTPSPPGS